MASTVHPSKASATTVGEHHSVDERIELVNQLQRSLALLRGCDAPGIRAQIGNLVASLHARLHHVAAMPARGLHRLATPPIPANESALRLSALECRSYAIQCESLASMAADAQHRQMLQALARLWRALAVSSG